MHGIETLKNRIHAGELVVGASVRMWSTRYDIELVMDRRSYDFLAGDAQHSPFSEHDLVSFCQIANDMGIPTQLRIMHAQQSYLIGNMLDLGPSMIEVPQVEKLSTVKDAFNNFYYPQKGRRSWGPSTSPQIEKFKDRLEYAKWWNAHGILWMQIESLSGIERAQQISETGADVLSWGPNDLAFDREAHPQHNLKTDDDCINYVLNALAGTKSRLCLRTYGDDQITRYKKMGATMFLDETAIASPPDV